MEPRRSGIMGEEEAKRIGFIPAGRGCWVRLKMKEMEVGQYLLVIRKDWNNSTRSPNDLVKDVNQKDVRQYELLQTTDKLDWFIKRIA